MISRTLSLDGQDFVVIQIFQPTEDLETDGHFVCKFTISGLSSLISSYGMGVDGVQAVCNAMELVGHRLYYSKEYKDGRLSWSCGINSTDLGFPLAG